MRYPPDSLDPVLVNRRKLLLGAAAAALGASLARGHAAEHTNDDHVVELRQYTTRKGQRDTLIQLFEKYFIEPQNALGAHLIGTFRDLDDPDRFVWLRGFHDMDVRKESLESFYGGPIWKAHRQDANATMIDSDNVLMLRPAGARTGFEPPSHTPDSAAHIVGARIHYLDTVDPARFATLFATSILPRVRQLGVQVIGQFITESAANNFRLPIREHDHVFVWFARWNALKDEEEFSRRWSEETGWRDGIPEDLLPSLMRKPERLRLAPTTRSELR